MTLRRRLTLVFGALVLLPLAAAGIFVGWAIPRATEQRTESTLLSAQAAVDAALVARCERAGIAVRSLARDLATISPQQATAGSVNDRLSDYVAIFNRSNDVVSEAGKLPIGTRPGSLGSCRAGETSGAGVAESVDLVVRGRPNLSRALAVEDVGDRYLEGLRAQLGLAPGIALVRGDDVVARSGGDRLDLTIAPSVVESAATGDRVITTGGMQAVVSRLGPGMPFDVVVALPGSDQSALLKSVLLVVVCGFLLAVVTARAIARDMTGPLAELTDAARGVATGDLTRTIDVRGDEEVRSLAHSFNEMTAELLSYITEVERSRDLVRGNVERMGEALSATHDLDTLLPVVLESAMSSVGAGAGVVLLAQDDGPFTVHAQHGLRTRGLDIPQIVSPGHGLLGRVASGHSLCGVIGSSPELHPDDGDPAHGDILAVPLLRGDRVLGVVALFDPVLCGRFLKRDEDELHTLAGQAAIAVENVLLHGEAKQASITDPLTGVWNVRYLTLTLTQEAERALRFHRPLSVLMLDLDHFKRVNDTYGHARGDDVLREFARRVRSYIREVDTLARYGGEEFVLVLPETDAAGAATLAERIVTGLRATPFTESDIDSPPLDVTVSIGAATFPQHGTTAPLLLRAADHGLYSAKRAGRDCWSVAEGVPA